jgi:Domain of unknown function (DUF4279)
LSTESLPHVWISLSIMGASFDPDVVTAQLGVESTSQHRIGDPIVGDKGRRYYDRWRVTVGPRDTLKIDAMLSELLAHIAPGERELKRVCQELEVEATLTCAVEPTSSMTPDIIFPPSVTRWAADHGVIIDVDLMLWGEEENTGN